MPRGRRKAPEEPWNDRSERDTQEPVWLSTGLMRALENLAKQNQQSIDHLVSALLNEALTHRLLLRPFKPPD